MLDKRSAKLMSILTVICADGSYKIIEIGELIKAMLPRFTIDAQELMRIIQFLCGNEMIDVKYSDENVHCIAVLPKGRVYEESRSVQKRGTKIGRFWWVFLIAACFIASFVGAVLARFV